MITFGVPNATQPIEGETRTQSGFLLFPLAIGGVTKWFGRAAWRERFTGWDFDADTHATWPVWEPVEWLSLER